MIDEIVKRYNDLLYNIKKRDNIMSQRIWAIHLKDSKYSLWGLKKQIKEINRLIKQFEEKDLEIECIKCSIKIIKKYYK